jgi:hypothetical protein
VTNDNGAGLRALFYGLCSLWDIDVWGEEQAGDMPADFYLPGGMGAYVVILPMPADRQVETGALRARQEKFIILDDWDLDAFRACQNRVRAAAQLHQWIRTGSTHAAHERRLLGISSLPRGRSGAAATASRRYSTP